MYSLILNYAKQKRTQAVTQKLMFLRACFWATSPPPPHIPSQVQPVWQQVLGLRLLPNILLWVKAPSHPMLGQGPLPWACRTPVSSPSRTHLSPKYIDSFSKLNYMRWRWLFPPESHLHDGRSIIQDPAAQREQGDACDNQSETSCVCTD